MEKKCMICGTTENVEREMFLKNDVIERVYDLCPLHWTQVYRRCLDDLLEQDDYKITNYIKMVADKLVCDNISEQMMNIIQQNLGKNLDEIEDLSELGVDHCKIMKGIYED